MESAVSSFPNSTSLSLSSNPFLNIFNFLCSLAKASNCIILDFSEKTKLLAVSSVVSLRTDLFILLMEDVADEMDAEDVMVVLAGERSMDVSALAMERFMLSFPFVEVSATTGAGAGVGKGRS